MENVVVTICREFGAEGHEIGMKLGDRLQVPVYDKDLLEMSARESGLNIHMAASVDEKVADRFYYFPLGADALNDQLFHVESNIIKQLAEKKACIIVGRLSDYVLRDRPNTIKVLVMAPFEMRVSIIKEKHQISDEAAKKLVKKMDAARNAYYSAYTGSKWSHETGKDIVLNRSSFSIEECADILEGIVRRRMA